MLTVVALFVLAALLVQFWTGISRAVKRTAKGLSWSKVSVAVWQLYFDAAFICCDLRANLIDGGPLVLVSNKVFCLMLHQLFSTCCQLACMLFQMYMH